MPRWALNGQAVVSPLTREAAEMAYQFEAPFHMDTSAGKDAIGSAPTPWEKALRANLLAWGAEGLRDAA